MRQVVSTLFYNHSPALLFSIGACCGYAFAVNRLLIGCFLLLFLIVLKPSNNVYLKILTLFIGIFCCVRTQCLLKEESWLIPQFEGHVTITNKREFPSYKKTMYHYSGEINKVFTKNGKHTFSINPPSIKISTTKNLEEGAVFFVQGILDRQTNGFYCKNPQELTSIDCKDGSYLKRFSSKKGVQDFLKRFATDEDHYHLYNNLLTGESSSSYVSFLFYRLGLSHLLAISGLHFAMAIALISIMLSRFIPNRILACILGVASVMGFWFLGTSPSITRAFIAAAVCIIAMFLYRSPTGLNTLGVCFLFSIFTEPLSLSKPGFLLSYLATFGILTLYTPLNKYLSRFLRMRFLCSALSLTLSVSIFTIPLTLYFFNEYPPISLISNLIFPPIVGLIYTLLLSVSLLFTLKLQAMVHFVFWLLSLVTEFLFCLLHYPPYPLLGIINVHLNPFALQIIILTTACTSLVCAYIYKEKERERILTKTLV